MKKTLTRETLEQILDSAGLDAEDVVYDWPSGMYDGYGGRYSFALTADVTGLAKFFRSLGSLLDVATYGEGDAPPEGLATLSELLPSGSDPLYKRTVTFFRGWELESE